MSFAKVMSALNEWAELQPHTKKLREEQAKECSRCGGKNGEHQWTTDKLARVCHDTPREEVERIRTEPCEP